jgi:diguanylate cyclase (GGDEF)-like protein/hemerythrin-like metal-binding protein
MFELDIRTFLIVVEVLMVVYTITAFFVYYVRRHIMNLLMGLALLSFLAVFIIIHGALDGPTTVTIVGYNVFFQCATMLIISGFKVYYQKNSFSIRYIVYIVLSAVLIWIFTQPYPSYLGRVGVSSLIYIIFIADVLLETRTTVAGEIKPIRQSIYGIMGVMIFLFTVRWIYIALNVPQSDLLRSMINTAYTGGFTIILFFSFWITGSVLMDSNSQVANLTTKTKKLENLAMSDPLTKLNNRNRLEADMHDYIELGNRQGVEVSLLLLDLDHFKEINDQYGHDVGDKVLISATEVISGILRSDDRLYRWGGDEFLVLTPHTNLTGVSHLAQRILDLLSEVKFRENITMTASIGCAQHFQHESKEDWFKRVDLSLHKAKRAGRNRFEVWSNSEALSTAIARLVWSDTSNSGFEEIDNQHKALVHLSNELYERLISSESVSRLDQILDQVLVELRNHFIYESDLMKKEGFTGVEEHMKIHGELLNEYDQLRLHLKTGETNLSSFFNFVSIRIVAEHFIKEDSKFFEFHKTRSA